MRERSVAEKLAVFPVNGDEVLRADQIEHQLLLFLAAVAGDVNRPRAVVVIDQGAAAEHVVEHPENRFFIPRNNARRKDDGVALVHAQQTVIVHGDARKRRHGLGLAATDQDDELLGIKRFQVLRADHHAVGNPQTAQAVGNFHVIHHAASDKAHFAAHAGGDVHHLLDARNGRGKARHDHFSRGRAEEFLEARHDGALGRREAGPLDVGAVAEQCENAFLAVARERVQIKRLAVGGRRVHLEIAAVDNHAERRANRQRHAVNRAVRDVDEFDFERAQFHLAAGKYLAKLRLVEQSVFFEAFFDQREREARSIYGNIQVAEKIRQGADVVFVPVGQNDGPDILAVLLEIGGVRDDDIHAEQLDFGEHHSGVNHDDVVAVTQGQHVHAELAQTAQGNCQQGRITQWCGRPLCDYVSYHRAARRMLT